ncbi:transcriptional protein Swt1 [Acrasis kona]|uniref:Transcriptional protein Swt1 n=1 Tax=Acrasis kona TaxID=1008807 RepID=A0AAW2YMW3_9EUKA
MKRKAIEYEPSEESEMESPPPKKSKMKEIVLGASSLNVDQQSIVADMAYSIPKVTFGASDFTKTTHLICLEKESSTCRRTLKVLFGILKGIFLLNIDWVNECLKHQEIVSESAYELTAKQCKGAKKARIAIKNKEDPLLHHKKAFLIGQTNLEGDVLIQLITLAGATLVRSYKQCDICIAGKLTFDEERTLTPLKNKPIVDEKWFTDSIYSYSVMDTSKYLVTLQHAATQSQDQVVPLVSETRVITQQTDTHFIVNGKSKIEKSTVRAIMRLASQEDISSCCSTLLIPLWHSTNQRTFTLGRSSENDFYINDRKPAVVSRKHSRIIREGDTFKVVDNNSTNGTYVNSIRIKECVLQDGDTVHFGHDDGSAVINVRVNKVNSSCVYVFEKYNNEEHIVMAKQYQDMMKVEIEAVKKKLEEQFKKEHLEKMCDFENQKENLKKQAERFRAREVEFINKCIKTTSPTKQLRNNPASCDQMCNYAVVDTNCLLNNSSNECHVLSQNQKWECPLKSLMNQRKDTIIVIPFMVLMELDGLKKSRQPLVAQSARVAIDYLDKHFDKVRNASKLTVPSIVGQRASDEMSVKERGLPNNCPDDRILNCCLYFKDKVINKNQNIYLLTNDKNLRVKAAVHHCKAFGWSAYLNGIESR